MTGFGNLFKDLVLVKYSNDPANTLNQTELSRITVPLVYGGKEVYTVRGDVADPNQTTPGAGGGNELPHPVQIKLPIITFSMTGVRYNPGRKQQSQLQQFMQTSSSGVNNQWQGVPYDLSFSVFISVRNIEDGLQIVEQILPWFTPSYTLALDLVPQMGLIKQVPITLDSVNWENDYEGGAPDKLRRVIWQLDFTMQTFFYGPVYGGGLITSAMANVSYYASSGAGGGATGAGGKAANNYTVLNLSNTGLLLFTTGEYAYQGPSLSEASAFGTVVNQPKASSGNANTLYLKDTRGTFVVNQNVFGALTAASWNVRTVPNVSHIVDITITPNPANANIANGDSFGYTTTILESPFA